MEACPHGEQTAGSHPAACVGLGWPLTNKLRYPVLTACSPASSESVSPIASRFAASCAVPIALMVYPPLMDHVQGPEWVAVPVCRECSGEWQVGLLWCSDQIMIGRF